MSAGLFHPAYFAPIDQFMEMQRAEEVVFEKNDYYRKQTYRTRMHIYGANGLLKLYIPVKHTGQERQYTRDVKIENAFPWQRNHWRSLVNAYRSSPFFEYYEDELSPLFERKFTYLYDFLIATQQWLFRTAEWEKEVAFTNSFEDNPEGIIDNRHLINAKKSRTLEEIKYRQVFEDKHGFIPNLNILDALFNLGPEILE